MEPKHVSYGNYSGPLIKGTFSYKPSANPGHLDRAFYITCMVETNAIVGSVQAYDGCSITCGLHQAILTYPKELANEDHKPEDDVGPLAELLVHLSHVQPFPELDALAKAFADEGWSLGHDSLFRYTRPKTFPLNGKQVSVKVGDVVYGAEIRNTITPIGGKVPNKGKYWEQSCKWAKLFHAVFAHPRSVQTQVNFGIEHMAKVCKNQKVTGKPLSLVLYGKGGQEPFSGCPELDLAMTVYHSHSVNAPAIALQKLNQAIDQTKFPGVLSSSLDQQLSLAKTFLRLIGTSTYGKWNHMEPNGRWQRTRTICLNTKYWDPKLFSTIMPGHF